MIIYDIPATQLAAYRGKPIVVRTTDPGALLPMLEEEDFDKLICISIEDLSCDVRPLLDWQCSGPIDLILEDPATEYPHLYQFSPLVESHPIRACIAVKPGFAKAVRLAAALHYSIKLEIGQPDAALIEELLEVLEIYLHGRGVTEPIEFFHSLLLCGCYEEPVSLWAVQENDPTYVRRVTDDHVEQLPGRLAACESVPADYAVHADCRDCPYRDSCGGFFKWPLPEYDCAGIKRIFETLAAASQALAKDLEKLAEDQKGATS